MVSTPNKAVYTDEPGHHNPFHPSEMYESEFVAALRERFPASVLFGQRVDAYSAIWPLAEAPEGARLLQARNATAADAVAGLPDAMYFIAVCASSPQALEGIGAPFSLLADQDHRVGAGHQALRREAGAIRARAERVEAAYVEAQARLAALVKERDRLAAQLQALPAGAWPKQR
jgi:hypothetical protein